MNGQTADVIVIGAAIADILFSPVSPNVTDGRSHPIDRVFMSFGGNAFDEALVLRHLGHSPVLVTQLGEDDIGSLITAHCEREGLALIASRVPGLDTGINAVLVSPDGDRSFLTNRNGSLRTLALGDILPAFDTDAYRCAGAVSLASLFVSERLPLCDVQTLLSRARSDGKTVFADTTRPKHGETADTLREILPLIDYFFPNRDEAAAITGEKDPLRAADRLLACGANTVVLKLGAAGCLLASAKEKRIVPGYPNAACIDTTGAGDSFAAAFIAAHLEGLDDTTAAVRANAVASCFTECLGATTARPTREEIDARCAVILSLAEA